MKRESFGMIPKPKKVALLKNIYRNMDRYIKRVIYSITLENYNAKFAKFALRELEQQIKIFNLTIGDFWDNTIDPVYREVKIKVSSRIEHKFKKKKKINIDHAGIIEKQVNRILRNTIKVNRSIVRDAEKYIGLLKYATDALENMQLQEYPSPIFKDRVKTIIDEGAIYKMRLNEGHLMRMGIASRDEITAEVTTLYQEELGFGAKLGINGRRYDLVKYADLVAKTEMRKAQTSATLNSCKEYKNDLVQFSMHAHMIPNYADFDPCFPLELEIFSISGESLKYPAVDGSNTPPIHPRCQHNFDPYDELLGTA